MLKMKITGLIITSLLLVAVSRVSAQKNLLTNGGFEDELYGWNNNGAKLTPWDLKSGKNSCAIVTQNADSWVGIDQTVKIPKKVKSVHFSAWIKAINVVKGKDDWNGAVFTIVFLDNQDKELKDGVNIVRITGTSPAWTLSEKVIDMPENASSFKILLAMGYASGTMLVDDVSATAVN